MVNIVVFDIIFLDVKDALVNACLYLLMLVYIAYLNREKVISALTALTSTDFDEKTKKVNLLIRLGIVLLIMAVIFGIDLFFVNLIRDQ